MIRNLTYQEIKDTQDLAELQDEPLKIYKSKVEFKNTKYAVPSDLFPLTSKRVDIFSCINVASIEQDSDIEKLIQAYNNVNVKVGRCYTNIQEFVKECEALGIAKHITVYVGWTAILGTNRLSHHCWAVYKHKHLIDFSVSMSDVRMLIENKDKLSSGSTDSMREAIVKHRMENKLPNSEMYTLGGTLPNLIYIGCPCEPDVGREVLTKILATESIHPCYTNIDANGTNKLQRMLLDAEAKR